ncbi:DnaJ domain-containing protein [Thermodesulfobacteriota bacterium]
MQNKNYYDILFVTRDASKDEIKKSYRHLALRYHPDKNEGDPATADRFKEINEAYTVLGDQEKKRQYDNLGHAEFNRPGRSQDNPFSQSPRGFQGPFSCRGRGMGMGRAFGRGSCGMGSFFRASSRPSQSVSSLNSNHAVQLITITREEARSGAEKEILVSSGGAKQRVSIRIPPDVKDKAMLFMKGDDMGQGYRDIYFQVNIIG